VTQLFFGVFIGLGLAYLIGRIVRSLIVSTDPADVTVLIASLAILTAVAAVACVIPARRATQLSPMEALRYE